jgi:hypothetical protein
MAAEQLPADQYKIGGQPTITGYEVIQATEGFEEDAEDKAKGSGQHKAKITYSRRKTLQLELEALAAGAPESYVAGGGLSATFDPAGTPKVWKVRSATYGLTRGVQTVSLDLISLIDELTPA